MPPRPKGPRLYLRQPRADRGSGAVWVIRDGQTEVSTGCGPDRFGAAEKALSEYLANKWTPDPGDRSGDPATIYVAEVIALYAAEKAPVAPDPSAVSARLNALLAWWGDKTLADVKRSTCNEYVAHRMLQPIKSAKDPKTARRVTAQGARRELEDLSAAVGFWAGEHPLTRRPKVTLPEKPESPRDALTRQQAARLLKAAMGHRWDAKQGRWERLAPSIIANRRHLRRFILIGIYTGTRPGVMPKILWHESPTQAWVDLAAGTIYRRGKAEKDHRTKRRPLVRIPKRLAAHMRRWHRIDFETPPEQRSARARDREPPSTVLHHGGRALAGKIRTGFEGCVRDAGLAPEITPHWLRHTCATWLMEGGVEMWDAAAYTGMTVATLEKCYGHHRPNHQVKARKALGGDK